MALEDPPLDPYRHRVRYAVAVVTTTLVLLAILWITRQAVLLIFLGITVGVLFFRTSRWLANRTGLPRGVTLAGVVLGILAGLAAAGYFGGPLVVDEARTLVNEAPTLIETARTRLGLPESVASVPSSLQDISGRLLGVFSSFVGGLAGILVVLLVAIYTAADPSRYTGALVRLVDDAHQSAIHHVLERAEVVLLGWLKGVGISVVVLGTLAAIGLTVIGVPSALALAAFAAAMTVIPNFGPFIGWAPALVVAFSQGTTMGLWTLGLALVAQQVEGSFITPKVQGEMVKVGPAFIIAGQIVLGALAGFLGVLLVVPVLGVGKVLVQELYIGPRVEGEPAQPDDGAADERAGQDGG